MVIVFVTFKKINLKNWFPLFHGTDSIGDSFDDSVLVDPKVFLEPGLERNLGLGHSNGQKNLFRVGTVP